MKLNVRVLRQSEHAETEKYFRSMHNADSAMRVYRILAKHYLEMKEENFKRIIEGTLEISEDEKNHFPPGDFLQINEANIGLRFLIELQAKNFFLEVQNFFDYMAQVIASFFCKNFQAHVIDFQKIEKRKKEIQKQDVKELVEYISNSHLFSYVRDYGNTVKHNKGIGVKVYTNTENLKMHAKIQGFSKRVNGDEFHTYPECDLEQKMEEVHSFANGMFGKLYELLKAEVEGLIVE